jgi:hypothetical protein
MQIKARRELKTPLNRSFPRAWSAEVTPNCFMVPSYIYYEKRTQSHSAAKLLSKDEALRKRNAASKDEVRRIANNERGIPFA